MMEIWLLGYFYAHHSDDERNCVLEGRRTGRRESIGLYLLVGWPHVSLFRRHMLKLTGVIVTWSLPSPSPKSMLRLPEEERSISGPVFCDLTLATALPRSQMRGRLDSLRSFGAGSTRGRGR